MNLSDYRIKIQNEDSKTKFYKVLISLLILTVINAGNSKAIAQQKEMMIRISEIEIDPVYLEEYKTILKEEAAASVELERGVIAIFPMYQKEAPTQIRILEMYANKAAYEQHLKTPHFQKYKTTTLKMVKALKLVDMKAVDAVTMTKMFRKLDDK